MALWNGDISNDLDRPLPGFHGHGKFDVKYLKNVCLGAKLLKNTNRKPYRMVPLSMT